MWVMISYTELDEEWGQVTWNREVHGLIIGRCFDHYNCLLSTALPVILSDAQVYFRQPGVGGVHNHIAREPPLSETATPFVIIDLPSFRLKCPWVSTKLPEHCAPKCPWKIATP